MKACTFATDGSGKPVDGAIPGEPDRAAPDAAREALIEMVAEADDALMEKFFDAGTLTPGRAGRRAQARRRGGADLPGAADLGHRQHRHAAAARRARRLRAVAGRAAAQGARRRRRRGRDRDQRTADRAAAFVWKTVADPFAGRITLFRVISGTLKADSTLHNADARRARAARPSHPAAGQDADQRPRDQGRRPRRRGEAEGHADERRARRQGLQRDGRRRSASPSR